LFDLSAGIGYRPDGRGGRLRYLGEQGAREFASRMDGDANVLFTIRPDRWLSADYSGDL
jgi:hypothetical protein